MIEQFINGFIPLAHGDNILAIVGGSVVGYLVGALPGLSATMGIALCLPFTFYLPPLASLLFLTSLYGAAEYGGSITAVTLNIPGETAATPTTFDGYPLTKLGFPAKALGMSIVASFYAGILSTITLILTAVPLASFALRFGPAEYFALGIFGLTAVAAMAGDSWLKGCIGIVFGLLINTIGIDEISGSSRYIFFDNLHEGLPLVPLLIGLFAISEVLATMVEMGGETVAFNKISGALPTMKEYLQCHTAMFRGTLIGYLIGIIPGAGKAVASFIAYNEEKRASKHPELFGTGVLEGVAAPEAANNSVVSGALVPLLTLGIPGSAAAAVLIGAFTIQGLQPGPLLFVKQPELVYGLFAGLLVGNVVMLAMGLLGTQLWATILRVPKNILTPIVLAITLFACYAESNSLFSIWLALCFGLLGFILRKFDFPVAPIVLAMVLGKMIEVSFRRSLILSEGNALVFVQSPVAIVLLVLAVLSIAFQVYRSKRKKMHVC